MKIVKPKSTRIIIDRKKQFPVWDIATGKILKLSISMAEKNYNEIHWLLGRKNQFSMHTTNSANPQVAKFFRKHKIKY